MPRFGVRNGKHLTGDSAEATIGRHVHIPDVNDNSQFQPGNPSKKPTIYTYKRGSYFPAGDCRLQPPSAEKSQEILRRSLGSVVESELSSIRRHLTALIASAPASKLEQMNRAIERTLAQTQQSHSSSNDHVRIAAARVGVGVARKRYVIRVANGSTKRGKKKQPSLPDGLRWPTLKYWQAHQRHGWNIVEFLERIWLPIIKAGAIDLHTLRNYDESAAMAISNYTRKDPKTGLRRKLPYNIPTKKEKNDLLLAKGLKAALHQSPDLGHVIAQRLKRGQAVPGI